MTVEWEINKTLDEVMPDRGVVGEITYSSPYAMYVEFDTAYATNPPFDPLFEWVQTNWDDISSGLKEMAKRDGMGPKEHKKAVTWIVIKAIKENGIEGVHFGKRAIEHGKSKADMVADIHAERENPYELMAENLVEIMFEHSQGTIENEAKSTGDLKDSGDWDVYEADDQ